MIQKIILILSACFLGLMGTLIFLKLKPGLLHERNEKNITYNEIAGAAILRKNILYTLNFEQQNTLVYHINQLEPKTQEIFAIHKDPGFEKIVIYRFNKPDLIIEPVGFDAQENLLFHIPEWNITGNIKLCLNNF